MNTTETLSIIIVTFNSEKYITKCVLNLLNSTKKIDGIKIIVVDNNSSDRTVKNIKKILNKKTHNNIILIENSENVGFSRAVNQGIKYCISSNYLLINPDLMVQKDTLKKVLTVKHKYKASVVGIKTVDLNGNLSGSYFRFPNLNIGLFDFTNLRKLALNDFWHKYFYYYDMRDIEDNFEVDVVTGGFMLIDYKVIKKIGYFDTDFFMYLEDIDFCLRAKTNNFKILLCNETLVHVGGASSNNKDKVLHSAWQKSRKIYFMKHFNLLTNLIIQPIFILDDLVILILRSIKK